MSLDIYLSRKMYLSYDEGKTYTEQNENVYSTNITHNLTEMAGEAGLYNAIWRPHRLKVSYPVGVVTYEEERLIEDNTTTKAGELIPIIEKGLEELVLRPNHFKKFDAKNGWGTYNQFVPFVEEYLQACKEHSECIVTVSR